MVSISNAWNEVHLIFKIWRGITVSNAIFICFIRFWLANDMKLEG